MFGLGWFHLLDGFNLLAAPIRFSGFLVGIHPDTRMEPLNELDQDDSP